MFKVLTITAAAGLLASCAGGGMMGGSPSGQAADAAGREALSAPAYLQAAGASDQFEIQSGQVAAAQATRPEVRAFAQMMVEHHTRTTADLMAAARQAGLSPPPPALTPDKAAKVAALRRADGAAFDAQYMREQVAAHVEALALHESYARAGDTPALRQAAQTTVPIVRQHLDQARTLAGPG